MERESTMQKTNDSSGANFADSLRKSFATKLPATSIETPQFELAPPPRKQKGLFEELLDKNHLVLHYDMQERPDTYEEHARDLVEQLAGGALKYDELPEQERHVLDVATLEFATRPANNSHATTRAAIVKRVENKLAPVPEPTGTLGPEEAMPAFWWLR